MPRVVQVTARSRWTLQNMMKQQKLGRCGCACNTRRRQGGEHNDVEPLEEAQARCSQGRTLAKQLKRSQSVEGMADVDANDPEAKARERERTIRELAMASESLARQMSKMAKPSEAADATISPQIVLSRPTAETVARYSQQNLVDGAAEGSATARSVRPGEEASVASANAATTNWSSAAVRRERMSEQRKTGGPLLQDSGRTRVMSWRERIHQWRRFLRWRLR